MKKAFTLAEVMVVVVLIGILSAILIPLIVKVKPDQNKVMFKKAYYITERVINELINDETLYPEDASYPGFMNESSVTIYGTSVSSTTKFCKLFKYKLNITDNTNDYCTAARSTIPTAGTASSTAGNFFTNDGIAWFIPTTVATSYSTVFVDPAIQPAAPTSATQRDIVVDINGLSAVTTKSPNCTYNPTTCKNPDQFTIHVRSDGKIIVDGTKEVEYLGTTSIQ